MRFRGAAETRNFVVLVGAVAGRFPLPPMHDLYLTRSFASLAAPARGLSRWALTLLLLAAPLLAPLGALAQTPTISGFSPSGGGAGTLVTITGTNLNVVRGARFGAGGLGLFTAQSATSLTVQVPVDAASGSLRLTTAAGVAVSAGSFAYGPRPAGMVASLSPAGSFDACQPRTLTGSATTPAFAMTRSGLSGSAECVVVQPDGKILLGGSFQSWQFSTHGTSQRNLTRINPDGTLDTGFNVGAGFDGTVNSIALQADGKILVGGAFAFYNQTAAPNLVRLNANGSLDTSFGLGSGFGFSFGRTHNVRGVVVQPDGKVVVVGTFDTFNGQGQGNVVRLNADGSRDGTFAGQQSGIQGINAVVLQDDGKVVIGGAVIENRGDVQNPLYINRLVRFNTDGTEDNTFVTTGNGFYRYNNGAISNQARVNSLALQADGKIVAGGFFTTYTGSPRPNLVRLLATGAADGGFTGTVTGEVLEVAVQRSGHVLVGWMAGTSESGLVRLNANGTDAGLNGYKVDYAGTRNASVSAVAEQPDGKLLIGGYFDIYSNFNVGGGPTGHNNFVRVNPDFSLNDATTAVTPTFTFSPGNTTTNPLTTTTPGNYSAVASLNGETTTTNTVTLTACPFATITSFAPASGPSGTLVTITGTNLGSIRSVRFGTGGLARFTAQSATSLTVQVPVDAATGSLTLVTALNNTIVSGGTFTYVPLAAGLTARLNPVGPFDRCATRTLTTTVTVPPFVTGTGFDGIVFAIAAQPDGKVLVGGGFTTYNGTTGQNNFLRLNPDGSRDGGFATGTGFDNRVYTVALQADGKMLVGGQFTAYNGATGQNRLIRLNANGTRDASFVTGTGFNAPVQKVAVQHDGKILVAGDFVSYNGVTGRNVVRLNADGSRDATFATGTGFDNQTFSVVVQPDGKILVGGVSQTFNGAATPWMVRLNPDGSRDAGFNLGGGFDFSVSSIVVQPDGKILAVGLFLAFNNVVTNRIIRLNANGSRDASFNIGTGLGYEPQALVLQPDGKVLVGGTFTDYNGATANRIVRLNTDGSRDATFATGTGFSSGVFALALQPNGQVLAGGNFTTYNGTPATRLIRLNADGSPTTTQTADVTSSSTFTFGGNPTTNPIYADATGGYAVVAAYSGATATTNTVTITSCPAPRITSLMPTTAETGEVITVTGTDLGDAYLVQLGNSGTIQVPATPTSATTLTFIVPGGLTNGGIYDVWVRNRTSWTRSMTDFLTIANATLGGFSPNSGPAGTLVTISGTNLHLVRGVRFGTGGLAQFTAQSSTSLTVRVPVDAATGPLKLITAAGNVLTGGTFTYNVRPAGLLATLSPAGPLVACQPQTLTGSAASPAFSTGTGFNNDVNALVVQADGRVLAGGNFTTYNGAPTARLARLLPTGALDAAFAVGTGFDNYLSTVAVQADGRVLVGGDFTAYNGTTGQNRLVRLNADGSRDATFVTGTGFDAVVRSVAVQTDGKVLVGGTFGTYNGTTGLKNLIRLNPDGTRDATFVTGTGFGASVQTVAVQADGKVLMGGAFAGYNGTVGQNRIIRLNADGTRDATFNTGTGFDGDVTSLAVQADGKVLVGGAFDSYNGTTGQRRIIRLNADGTRDATFGTGTGLSGSVRSVIVQPDGKVLVGGSFTAYNGTTGLNRLIRLNADGTRDAAFTTGTGFDRDVFAVAVQADGKVLAGGGFTDFNGTRPFYVARLTPAGALDTAPTPVTGASFTFSPGGSTTNPLVTSTVGSYTAIASLNGETSGASNTVTLTTCPAPTITSFTPTSGATNTVVTVTGTNLSFASAASVNGTAGTIQGTPTATSLTFTVAAGSTTGPVRVTTLGGTATSAGTFTVDAVTVTGLSPASGGTGTVVTLTGTNLLGATAVRINNVAVASFTVNSDTQITFTVASGNTTGAVSVTMPGGGTYTGGAFTVDQVTITSFTPTSGGANTVVVITGTNLLGTTAVKINNVSQPGFVVNSATQITFTTSATVTTGAVSVTTPGSTATGGTFTVTPLSITGFSPMSGPAGTLVTITGTSLDQIRGVRFGAGGLALFAAQSVTSLTVVVPTDAATGVLTLTTQLNASLTSAGTFTYTPRPAGLLASLSPAGPQDACAPRTLTATAASPAFGTGTGLENIVNGVAGPATVNGLVAQADGKVLVGGSFTTYGGAAANRLLRLLPNGSPDATFITGTGFDAAVSAVAVQADGKVLVGGSFTTYNGTAAARLLRLHADGTLDATFSVGTGFTITAPATPSVQAVVVQPDGRILVGGSFETYNGSFSRRIVRLNPDGSRDATFSIATGFDNTVSALAVQPDGKVLVGGSFTQYGQSALNRIARLTATGGRDFGFFIGTGFNGGVVSLVVQPDGKVLVGGSFTQYGTTTGQNGLIRLNTNGTHDTGFATGTGFATTTVVNGLALQPDGKVVVVGNFTAYNGITNQNRLIRLNANGTHDASLATGTGFAAATGFVLGVRRVLVQPDGNLVIGGNFTGYNGTPATRLIRLTATGSVNNAPTAVSGATFTFSPGNTTANPLVTSTAGDYSVVASLNGEASAASNTVSLTACPLTITGFTPVAGPVGTVVTVTGTDLSTATAVRLNGTAGTLTGTPTATSLTFTVAAGSTTGTISVTTPVGTATSTGSFTVITNQAPTALDLAPQSVAENTGANAVVGDFTTTDPDAADTFTYSLVSGAGATDNGLVNISGTQVRITASPDYETQASYAIRVRTTDQDGLFTEQPFTISVTNVNEAATNLTLSNSVIAENVGPNALVGTLSNNDPDAGDTFRYMLVNGPGAADGGYFTIVGNELRLNAPADYETKATYEIAVFVSDQNNQGRAERFVISVTDVAEDLIVSTTGQTIAAGTYHDVTITGTGEATLSGDITVTGALVVQDGGVLNTACQAITGAGTFTLAAGATLSICSPQGITASGATGAVQVTGVRSFASDATYIYNGTQLQTTGNGLPATVRALETANPAGVTLAQAVSVTDVLRLTSGTLATGGQLTLLSTATRTAYAAHAGGATSGAVTVQRYVPAPLAVSYRHLSSPVQAAPVSDLATAGFVPKVNPAYNALPYVAPTPALFPTVFGYDETRGGTTPAYAGFGTGYFSPATLAETLTSGRGYSVYLPGQQTPDFVGALTTGSVPVALTVTGTNTSVNAQKAGWHLLGNPYPQPIDWDLATVPPGLDPTISVWYSTGGSAGAYRFRNATTQVGNLTDGVLALGQGFFARATAATILTFTNALRVENNTVLLGRPGASATATTTAAAPLLRLNLTQVGASAAHADATFLTTAPSATPGLDAGLDALRPGRNVGVPTLATRIGGQEAAINALPETALSNAAETVVELTAALPTPGAYTLTVGELTGFGTTSVELLDRLTGTRYDLAQHPTLTLSLAATRADEEVAGRFAVVINRNRVLSINSKLETENSKLEIAPNPATAAGGARISGAVPGTRLVVADLAGRIVASLTAAAAGTATLPTRHLAPGVYTVRAPDGRTARLVVE